MECILLTLAFVKVHTKGSTVLTYERCCALNRGCIDKMNNIFASCPCGEMSTRRVVERTLGWTIKKAAKYCLLYFWLYTMEHLKLDETYSAKHYTGKLFFFNYYYYCILFCFNGLLIH